MTPDTRVTSHSLTTPNMVPNMVPSAYRCVSVARVDRTDDLPRLFLGREAYRHTRFLVVRDDAGGTALLRVEKESDGPLFSPISSVEVLAPREECAYVLAPEADVAVPSTLARIALSRAPGVPAVVVEGMYGHVSFIGHPAPLRLVVQEVVPPEPPKLLDQVRRLLEVADDLPPIVPVADTVTFEELAARTPAERYLLPCGGSGVTVAHAPTAYLDQRPEPGKWTLLGCARSREIHEWFYGERPPTVEMCPRSRARDPRVPTLTKCCLLEDRIEHCDGSVVVPWGATLGQVRTALEQVARTWEPSWRPV
ncbi:DUF7714 family protein [Nonomuraea lactucae]|uniref:DUF7714 family protein n=1 Tax=Nonomuraea lactucae TaxID=2249762 RepID=UPI000DE44C7F|nr:hypothetical protein [Nonomuraea lactucae]